MASISNANNRQTQVNTNTNHQSQNVALKYLVDPNTKKSKYAYPIFKELSEFLGSLKGKTIQYFFQGFDGQTMSLGGILKDTNGKNLNSGFLGTSPGYVIEQAIYKALENAKYSINHTVQGNTWDFIIQVPNPEQNGNYKEIVLDSKSAIKNSNAKVSDNQYFYIDEFGNLVQKDTVLKVDDFQNDPKFIIYTIYTPSIEQDIVTLTIHSCTLIPVFLVTQGQRVSLSGYNQLNKEYIQLRRDVKSIYEELIFSHTGKQLPRSINETISYLDSYVNEAKKYVQTKKFIDDNFTKKGDYLYPINGNKKCSFHSEYDKGLLKFFAEHGISKIESVYSNNTPSLGFSEQEQKWYGWSHRAIYGFGVGDKIKKGTCGYEKMKEKGLLDIKTLDQAKDVAKIFAKDIG